MTETPNIQQLVSHLFRHEAGKITAVLTKLFGLSNVEMAEDIVQETLIAALETWKIKGIPENPRAWLYKVAKNRTLDVLKRQQHLKKNITPNITFTLENEEKTQTQLDAFFLENEIQDALLRTLFACCTPSVSPDAQLILMLKTLCGLTTAEIAPALLSNADTVTKKLYRAKEKIKNDQLSLDVPTGNEVIERLDAVMKAIYLLFTEGYYSTSTDRVIRRDLCDEALRLGILLADHPLSNSPKTAALVALMCFQSARFEARIDSEGQAILLENQNRKLWNPSYITLGYDYFQKTMVGTDVSTYHLEAAIASYHIQATSFETTNWQAIYYCYNLLFALQPSPIVALNRAIALGFTEGASRGIVALNEIKGLGKNAFYHAALGDFLKKNGDINEAKEAYDLALKCTQLESEKRFILLKITQLNTLISSKKTVSNSTQKL
jgi:RNA polymerase sigma factor (sigma-70 family)